jgi:hypothetical protein
MTRAKAGNGEPSIGALVYDAKLPGCSGSSFGLWAQTVSPSLNWHSKSNIECIMAAINFEAILADFCTPVVFDLP